MDFQIRELINELKNRKNLMVEQLHQFCEINSGTENLLGLGIMQQTLQAAFNSIADHIETLVLPPVPSINMAGENIVEHYGNALLIRKRPELKRRILLSGHMDTVYGIQHPFQRLTELNNDQIIGPGVADMKGGLIVALHALSCFEETPEAADLGWDMLINADEEVGSPASGPILANIAANYQAALIYEPAITLQGTFAKNRRGSGKLTLVARGKASHVGRAFFDGRNAICYLAEALIAIHALNNKDNGITINVGRIAGGGALNVVPDIAVAKLDIRISKPDDEYWVREKLNLIIEKMARHDYSLTLEGNFGRPVKRVCIGTERLFARIQTIGHSLGLSFDWQDSGGCCDGNNLAQYGLPVIDTLGVRGGNIHSPQEFMLVDSFIERSALNTLLIRDLARGGLEELRL